MNKHVNINSILPFVAIFGGGMFKGRSFGGGMGGRVGTGGTGLCGTNGIFGVEFFEKQRY